MDTKHKARHIVHTVKLVETTATCDHCHQPFTFDHIPGSYTPRYCTKPECSAALAAKKREQTRERVAKHRASQKAAAALPPAIKPLLAALQPEAQTIATLCKHLGLTKAELERLITQHLDELVHAGVHLHVATASATSRAIKLPSQANPNEPTYYASLSKNLFSLP